MQKRIITTEFAVRGGLKRFENISCKFRIEKYMGAVMNKANIDIANLAREDVEYLTTYTSYALAVQQRKRIRISAGYEGQDVALLFDGDISEALPTTPPDVWLRCKAISGFYNNQTLLTKSIDSPTSVKQLAMNIANTLGLELDWRASSEKTIGSFNYIGGGTKLIDEFNRMGNFIAFEEDGKLKVVDSINKAERVASSAKVLSEDSGLIDMPQPNALGLSAKMLLDPTVVCGSYVKLESKRIPAANGFYWVYKLAYEGSLREESFYTSIEARRI